MQSKVGSMQASQIDQTTSKFNELTYSQKDLVDRARMSNKALAQELDDKKDEIEKLKYLLQDRTKKLAEVSVSYDQQVSKLTLLENEVILKDRQIKSLIEKADQVKNLDSVLFFTELIML